MAKMIRGRRGEALRHRSGAKPHSSRTGRLVEKQYPNLSKAARAFLRHADANPDFRAVMRDLAEK